MSTAPSDQGSRMIRFPRRPRRPVSQAQLDAQMSLIAHLRELRDRLVRAALSVTITTALAFIFVEQIFKIVVALAPAGLRLQGQEPTEVFGAYFSIALTVGIAASMPLILYQIFRFLAPGLYPNERRWIVLG